jgi:hypothetical protein
MDAKGEPARAVLMLDNRRLTPSQARQKHIASLRKYAQKLGAKGINLVLVVDNPVLAQESHKCSEGNVSCAPSPSVTRAMQSTLTAMLGAVARGLPNVFVFDPTPYFLQEGKVRYRLDDGRFVFTDDHHLSISGSRLIAEPFYQFLVKNGLVGKPSKNGHH